MKWLYQVFGVSKQGYYKRQKSSKRKEEVRVKILNEVSRIRRLMPMTGTRKLMEYLGPFMLANDIKLGRDALFELLRNRGMLVRKTKQFHITTDSHHIYNRVPNLINDMRITHAEQVFVTDITYIKTDVGYSYLSLVTDAYSKKIMGWSFDDNMKVSMVKQALKMAYKNCIHKQSSIIHHSDRGKQYCCPDYREYASKMGFVMSTTQSSDPYENAIAERVNGILKYEFGLRRTLASVDLARKMIKEAIEVYNHERKHWSLGLSTPEQAHRQFDQHEYKSYKKPAA